MNTNTVAFHSQLTEALRRSRTDSRLKSDPITVGDVTLDYASAGLKIDVAKMHLDESIPNKQPERTEAAFRSLREGFYELQMWLRMSGYDV